jgi:integrase
MGTTPKGRTGQKRGNNEGNIYQRQNGLWEGRVSLPGGNRKSVYGTTRAEAQRKLTALLRDVQQGIPVPTGPRQTLAQFLERWLEDVVKPSVRPSTYTSYEQKVRVHIVPTLGKLPLNQVMPQRIQAFMNEKREAGQSPRSVQYLRAVLRRALGQALKWDLVSRNAATLVDPPHLSRRTLPVLNAQQSETLMQALDGDRLQPLVTLMVATGLRRGEALGLRWSDIDFDEGTVSVHGQYQRIDGDWTWVEPKTETSTRTLALPAFAIAALRTQRTRQLEERLIAGPHWADYDLVFPTATGTPQDGGSVSHQFAKRVRRANEIAKQEGRDQLPPITLHGLRHTMATMMLAHGLTLGEIQKVLGHSQIALTADLYAHFAPEIARRAARTMDAIFGAG